MEGDRVKEAGGAVVDVADGQRVSFGWDAGFDSEACPSLDEWQHEQIEAEVGREGDVLAAILF